MGVASGEEALRRGDANFVVVIPPDFERDVVRGLAPEILIAADASDPSATGGAVAALSGIVNVAISETLTGPLAVSAPTPPPFGVVVHREYNPEGRTSTNIVPGLLAIILSMTMVMITAVAIVKESERGTMEMLIATPVRPLEVMLGKILPYVFVGYVQTVVFLTAAKLVFGVPFEGSPLAFFVGFNLFIVVNLALGFLISTAARSQMQAMQLSFFTILPSILLSGFMFPFAGMPGWAQVLGTGVPATHFLLIVRKVMLKGGELGDVTHELMALGIILVVISGIAMMRYRQTLD
jgi:ABC-2 type transport system permease protein